MNPRRPVWWLPGVLALLGGMIFLIIALIGALLILPLARAEKDVTVIVNGQPQTTTTRVKTVASLLDELDIPLNDGDTISPALNSRLTHNLVVRLNRARSVTLTIDGQSQVYRTHLDNPAAILESLGVMVGRNDKIIVDGTRADVSRLADWPVPVTQISLRRTLPVQVVDGETTRQIETTSQTVGEALFEAGITLFLADEVQPDLNKSVTADMVITIQRAQPVHVIADGETIETRVRGATVADALAEAGVVLVGQDYTIPDESGPLRPGMRMRVIRVSEDVVFDEATQPFETIFQADPSLELDQRQTLQAGQNGVTRTAIRVRYENGVEVSREAEETIVIQEARDQIIAYGTNIVLRTVETPAGPRQYWRRLRMWATSYHPEALGGDNITATGEVLRKGIVASNPDIIRYGSEVFVPGYGIGVMADTGPLYRPLFIDLGYDDENFMPWARWVDVYLLAPVPENVQYLLPGSS